MATFDVSFLNPKFKKGSAQDYGFLVDQLDIMRSQLEFDGKLSPGDYDLLNAQAQKIYAHPGLTQSQRSNIEVKIAGFNRDKKVNAIKGLTDIEKLNREIKDDASKIGLRFSNDPTKFLQAQAALQNAKIDQLSESIDTLENASDDSSNHINELNAAMLDYSDTLQALSDVENFSGNEPISDYASYVTTNASGEIIDLKIGRIGSRSGYLETNGLYGGLPVYGKVNRKEYGKNIFKLGNQTFSANDVVIPGPDGTLRPSVLISSEKQRTGKGGFSIAESGYTPIDLTSVRSQSALREGSWAEGEKGFLYQKQADGSYKKYVNSDKTKLGISDNDIIGIPRSFESTITKSVSETIDRSPSQQIPVPETITPSTAAPQQQFGPPAPSQTPPLGTGRPRTPAPTERAPESTLSVAQKAFGAAKGYLGSLFGK